MYVGVGSRYQSNVCAITAFKSIALTMYIEGRVTRLDDISPTYCAMIQFGHFLKLRSGPNYW
jgi:hypothetical protein